MENNKEGRAEKINANTAKYLSLQNKRQNQGQIQRRALINGENKGTSIRGKTKEK